MLQTSTIEPATLDILKKLMSISELSDFTLVGGTALSLRFGHRKSIDLDLFSSTDYDYDSVLNALKKAFLESYKHNSTKQYWNFQLYQRC